MDASEELYIEGVAFVGSMHDTAVKIITNYPDLPEEVTNFVRLVVAMLGYAETEVFTKPQAETFVKEILEEM